VGVNVSEEEVDSEWNLEIALYSKYVPQATKIHEVFRVEARHIEGTAKGFDAVGVSSTYIDFVTPPDRSECQPCKVCGSI